MASRLQLRQALVFSLGWIAYASTYLLRKPLGVIKTDLEDDLKFSKLQLGWMDTALLLPYAVMQMFLGSLGDRFGARKTFALSLIVSGLSMISLGQWSSYHIFIVLLFINGTAQSLCWPSCSKTIGAWFSDSTRNTVFGIYGTSAFAGGIAGTSLAVYLQSLYSWRSVFFLPSVILILLGVVVLICFCIPADVGIEVPGKAASSTRMKNGTNPTFLQLWQIPMVPEISVGMFCLKLVRYCMYMWLPMYLLQHLSYAKTMAGMFSTMFEIGGVAGSAFIGFILDRCFQGRSLLGTALSMLLSTAALLMFAGTSSWGYLFNSLFMVLAGAFNCGPDSILGGAIGAELGEMDGRNAAAAVTGIINGFGSVGAFIEGPLIGLVSGYYGWSGMFYLMVLLSLCGTLSVFRAAIVYSRQKSGARLESDLKLISVV
ncbi:putative glycerol-3-phosphate transporter 5 isoform X1 [Lingula anatina]|uniref:Glycerol-3-phosphate transporter 5 isoform X1 n=1 Tax=Lingula anatina TaxID=7574 RepID=A0A1S3ICG2_LINAN|nr:putative glycerol-3-phosphate transporter 5 isoform X1 [Lingula anatina]|eukprot:XP_013395114.1 putative glycerol-3-phosphate transporter 5 isoform X1 [Lingula anatina]